MISIVVSGDRLGAIVEQFIFPTLSYAGETKNTAGLNKNAQFGGGVF